MKVKLIAKTPQALTLLLYTKNTRLDGAQSFDDIYNWPMEKKLEHLEYMRNTIKSSWEFVDYTFEITGVSRVFTHQLVRTRQGSYAQQSQRTVKAKDIITPNLSEIGILLYKAAVEDTFGIYDDMILEDEITGEARYVLPMGTSTNIIAKFNLRTLHEMANVRLCTRTQGEYQEVFKAMKQAVIKAHPWAEPFIQVACINTGQCIFPNYKECPVQAYTSTPPNAQIKMIKKSWEETDHVANPKAKDGKTM